MPSWGTFPDGSAARRLQRLLHNVRRIPAEEVAIAAARHRVPVELARRIIRIESGGNCRASSGVAFGVMQVRPQTARAMGVYGDLRNCETGLEAGLRYLRAALDLSGGSWARAATLYNRGLYAYATPRSRYARMVMR